MRSRPPRRHGGLRGLAAGAVHPHHPRQPVTARPSAPGARPAPAHPRPGYPGPPHRDPAPARGPAPAGSAGGSSARTLTEFGALQLPGSGLPSNIHCLTVIGQIEGHLVLPPQNKTTKYEHSIPQLVAIELNPAIEGLLVVLNTVGGDVEAGLAIAEMVASLSKPKVSLIVGGGHSIGVPIAVAADRSFITHTATMTIHPIRLSGLVVGVPQTYEYLDKMQDRVVKFIVANSRISEQRFRDLMFRTGELARDVGTVLVGHDAVSTGLIDEVGGMEEAIAALRKMIAGKKGGPAQAGERARPAAGEGAAARREQDLMAAAPRRRAGSPGFYPGLAPDQERLPRGVPPGSTPGRLHPPAPPDVQGPQDWGIGR